MVGVDFFILYVTKNEKCATQGLHYEMLTYHQHHDIIICRRTI